MLLYEMCYCPKPYSHGRKQCKLGNAVGKVVKNTIYGQ